MQRQWTSFTQIKDECSFHRSDKDLTFGFKRNIGDYEFPKIHGCFVEPGTVIKPGEEIFLIVQESATSLPMTPSEKEKIMQQLRDNYPETKKVIIRDDDVFSFTNFDDVVSFLFDRRSNDQQYWHLFDNEKLYKLRCYTYVRIKDERKRPCCPNRGNVGCRGESGPSGPGYLDWNPSSYLQSLTQ